MSQTNAEMFQSVNKKHSDFCSSLVRLLKKMVKALDHFTVCQIITLRKLNFSYKKIADQLGLKNRSTAQAAVRRVQKTGSFYPKKSTGRRPKLTEKDEKKLVSDTLKNPKTSLERIRVNFNSFSTGPSISRSTVRRILKKHGVFSRSAAKTLLLTKKSEKNRLQWCREMRKKPFSYWQNVVFTDETRIRLCSDGIVRVFRKNGTRNDPKNCKSFSNDRRSLMFWGAIRSDGRKCLIKCPNTLNSSGYLKILEEYDEKMHFGDLIFMQDNAPVHKAKKVDDFFKERRWNILKWPAYSPDLNPIENLWAILKKRLQKQTITWENLEEKVMEIWNSIAQETVQKLYENYETRLKNVIKLRGAISKY